MILRILQKVHGLIKSCLFQTNSIHGSLLNSSNHHYWPLLYSLGTTPPKHHQMFKMWEHGPFLQWQNCAFLISNIVIFPLLLHGTEMTFDNYSVLLILHLLQFSRTDLCFTMENTRTKIISGHSQFQKKANKSACQCKSN